MLKMTGLDVLFAAAGNLYLLLALVGIGVALWKGKTRLRKVIYAALVLALFIAPVAPQAFRQIEYRNKLAKAQALFDERCKTAGERIYRTVDDVEGVLLMKVRPDKVNFSDQYAMDDPYGRDVGGRGYIGSFLRVIKGASLNPNVAEARRFGFGYVEAVDAVNNKLYRYTGIIKTVDGRDPNFELEAVEMFNRSTRYGVTYEDISTHEDRESWIAGGVLKVIDLEANSLVAERRGYIFDRGLGNVAGGRGPWEAATACRGTERKYGHNAQFVLKSLKPTKGE